MFLETLEYFFGMAGQNIDRERRELFLAITIVVVCPVVTIE
uniref:Bm14467 n=1 Tax=Brugia malayi TaxID=6279 RepID=A0A1I9G004_BRUMA|nr:Bm14467 [Brugia malayi]